MATRIAARYVSRRMSTSGKILSEEEKAAENVYIKKMEKERLEKLARQGASGGEASAASSGGAGSVADAKPSVGQSTSGPKASTDSAKNYVVLAGIATIFAAGGWYLATPKKKVEE